MQRAIVTAQGDWPVRALAGAARSLGSTLLSPGSTYSFAAAAVSLALFTVLMLAGKRRRPLRARVLLRAIIPRRMWRTASARADLAYFVGGILFGGLAIGWAIPSADLMRGALDRLMGVAPALAPPGPAAQAIATLALFLAYEFAYWLDHWLSHAVPALWHFHKVHHQAESLSFATNGRVHPVDALVFASIVALVLSVAGALLDRTLGAGVAPFTIGGANFLIFAAMVGLTHLQHSHLWVGFGPRWGRVFLGPAHHQIHHSADPRHFNRNLGSSLALFDRLFGTLFVPAARREPLRFGVDDDETAPHGPRAMLVQPFLDAGRSLLGGARGLKRLASPVRHPARADAAAPGARR